MTKHKDTVPAAPDTLATPPASEKETGTSHPAPNLFRSDDKAVSDGGDYFEPASSAEKAPAPKPVPGATDFDINAPGVSSADLQEHLSILSLRKQLADLDKPAASPVAVTVVDAPVKAVPAAPNPTDIRAVKDGEERYFSDITWAAMETKGEHAGWEQAVPKPSDLT